MMPEIEEQRAKRGTRLRSTRLAGLLSISTLLLSGCGGAILGLRPGLVVSPRTASVDTNCNGCNLATETGAIVEQFDARMNDGSEVAVRWSLAGAHTGTISANGLYTPPNFITADRELVTVTATAVDDSTLRASTTLAITPGFFSPLTPQNIALAPGGSAVITGQLSEAGGTAQINFSLARNHTETNPSSDLGRLSGVSCHRSVLNATNCSVTYTAPAAVNSHRLIDLVATVGGARTTATILVNPDGITSSPVLHQTQQNQAILLGSSGGNAQDYETVGTVITGCCGGTLGALVQDGSGTQYVLSNNHILALSDQATVGESIAQPGLIDNDCSPVGVNTAASLIASVPLKLRSSNVDAALAQFASGAFDASGRIQELGAKQADGMLSAAAPGVSSTGGKGELVSASLLPMQVAKSGRTTGLTCASVSAVALDLTVDYFKDCAETIPYLAKTFNNQIAISGNGFGDAGDSGSLVVDASNAEPVGLYFAGGVDTSGVSHAVANPAAEVLSALSAQLGTGGSLSFVGGADHAVNCLSYGDGTVSAAQARSLSPSENARAFAALAEARKLVSPTDGVLAVAAGKSNDRIGEAAVVIAVEEGSKAQIPAMIGGVRTQIFFTDQKSLQVAGMQPRLSQTSALALTSSTLANAIQIKNRHAGRLMKENAGIFGVGVGQSLDDSRSAALLIYVDRRRIPATLPTSYEGLRTRYVFMDRMHVTREYSGLAPVAKSCHRAKD